MQKKIERSSPFIDPLAYKNNSYFHGAFNVYSNKATHTLHIVGDATNPAFIKGVEAPYREWHNTKRYVYKQGRFFTASKAQTLKKNLGVKLNPMTRGGEESRIYGFFEEWSPIASDDDILIYGRDQSNKARVVFAEENFADWLYKNFKTQINEIIYDAGLEILRQSEHFD